MQRKNKAKKETVPYHNRSFSITTEYSEVSEILDNLPRGAASKYICLAILTYNKILENPEWLTKEVINPGSLNELAQNIDTTGKTLLPVKNEEFLRHLEMEKTFNEMKDMMDKFNGFLEQAGGLPQMMGQPNQPTSYSELEVGQQEMKIEEAVEKTIEEPIVDEPVVEKPKKADEVIIEEIDASAFSGPILPKKNKSAKKKNKNVFGTMNVLGESKE